MYEIFEERIRRLQIEGIGEVDVIVQEHQKADEINEELKA